VVFLFVLPFINRSLRPYGCGIAAEALFWDWLICTQQDLGRVVETHLLANAWSRASCFHSKQMNRVLGVGVGTSKTGGTQCLSRAREGDVSCSSTVCIDSCASEGLPVATLLISHVTISRADRQVRALNLGSSAILRTSFSRLLFAPAPLSSRVLRGVCSNREGLFAHNLM